MNSKTTILTVQYSCEQFIGYLSDIIYNIKYLRFVSYYYIDISDYNSTRVGQNI